ncbi:hypothetical protein ACRCUN_12860 [Mycobacterium sp. LTG2003]
MDRHARFKWIVLTAGLVLAWTMLSSVGALAEPDDDLTTTPEVPVADVAVPTITLSVDKGGPGSAVTANTTGMNSCMRNPRGMIALWWDEDPLSADAVRTVDFDSGSVAFDFTVPTTADAREHTVSAQCRNPLAPAVSAPVTATFRVTSTEKPTLTLDPSSGAPGNEVAATGSGFPCRTNLQLLWDGVEAVKDDLDVTFATTIKVPPNAEPGPHFVETFCEGQPDLTVQQPFSVTGTVTTPVTTSDTAAASEPVLTVQPNRGRPDDSVRISGTGFTCTSTSPTVDIWWEGRPMRSGLPVDGLGEFSAPFVIPTDAGEGPHEVRATCSGKTLTAKSEFRVVPATAITPRTWQWLGWLVAALVLAAIVAAALHFRSRRHPRTHEVGIDVRAEPHVDTAPTVSVSQAPEGRTLAIRLEAHPDPGTQTVREV